jgi:sirohydrochlorin ferrochelatase
MIGRFFVGVCVVVPCLLSAGVGHAQDVPGIEICTVEKTMERRTSCLQSNVEFLQKTIARLDAQHQQKLDAAKAQIEVLKANVAALQKIVSDLQAAQHKPADEAKKASTPPPDATAKDTVAKDAAAKDATKDTAAKDGAKQGAK